MRILFLNPQGNFDKYDTYWTEHPDFGGQLVYVKEIAIELAKLGHSVDIVTRYIHDKEFPAFNGEFDSYDQIDNVRIVRIRCGGETFLRKELLWTHLDEWVNNIITFYKNEHTHIDFATGHYGDGGLACAMLKEKTGVPYSFTGHSLGAQKLDKLGATKETFHELDQYYHFTERILAERTAITNSNMVFVSTKQEQREQYTHPLYKVHSEHANFVVAPPGANTEVFAPYNGTNLSPVTTKYIESVLARDLNESRMHYPLIICASRLDKKKNHKALLRAFALDQELQNQANLLISVRGIDDVMKDYSMADKKETEILDELMDIIKEYHMFHKVTFINIRSQTELAELYRYGAKNKGIFTLTAVYEPFGLAPIEAMSTGLPAVVTKYGGPSDVLKEGTNEFGVLVDVFEEEDIARGLKQALHNHEFYSTAGRSRVLERYTWKATAKTYIDSIQSIEANVELVDVPQFFYSHNREDLPTDMIVKRYLDIKKM